MKKILLNAFVFSLYSTLSVAQAPTVPSSNISFTIIDGNFIRLQWTSGNGARRIVVARAGSAVTAVPVNGVDYNTSTTFGTGDAGVPQTQATNAIPANITGSSMQINWTNGNGNRRMVFMKQGSAVDATPVDNTIYTSSSFFGSGSQVGTGNYVVFDGVGSSVTITGLSGNRTYYFAIFEYNSFGVNSQFLVTNPARGNAATLPTLPVAFSEFKAISRENNIQLQWSTAQEQNTSHFEVERSNDGINFTIIGIKRAAGNSTALKQYSFTDHSPFDGANYYRLKQLDLDSRSTYSAGILARYVRSLLIKRVMNPVFNSIDVELNQNGNGTWRLYDMNGRLLKEETFIGSGIREDGSSLKEGVYILEVTMNNKTERAKFRKQ